MKALTPFVLLPLVLCGTIRAGNGDQAGAVPLDLRRQAGEALPGSSLDVSTGMSAPFPDEEADPPEREWDVGVALGVGVSHRILGSTTRHDLAVSRLHVGRPLTGLVGGKHWYRGQWELRGELLAGAQFDDGAAYLVGLTPVVRYQFASAGPWRPFVAAGAGVTGTDISEPDLSSTFQFNLQAGMGLEWKLARRAALTLEYRFLHLSNARIRSPNLGVNASVLYVGINWRR